MCRWWLLVCALVACGDGGGGEDPFSIAGARFDVSSMMVPPFLVGDNTARAALADDSVLMYDQVTHDLMRVSEGDRSVERFSPADGEGTYTLLAATVSHLYAIHPAKGLYDFPMSNVSPAPRLVSTPFDPRPATKLVVAGGRIFVELPDAIWRSATEGSSWTKLALQSQAAPKFLGATVSGDIYVDDGGVFVHGTQFGDVLTPIDTGPTLPQSPTQVTPLADGSLLLRGQDNKLYRSTDHGDTSVLQSADPPVELVQGPSGALFGCRGNDTVKSIDAGATWTPIALIVGTPLRAGARVFLGGAYTDDDGATWKAPLGVRTTVLPHVDARNTVWSDDFTNTYSRSGTPYYTVHGGRPTEFLLGVHPEGWIVGNGWQSMDHAVTRMTAPTVPFADDNRVEHHIGAVAFSGSPMAAYVGTWDTVLGTGEIENAMLRRLAPGDTQWTIVSRDLTFQELAIDVDGVMFAQVRTATYVRSTDAGATWEELHYPEPVPFAFYRDGQMLARIGPEYIAPDGTKVPAGQTLYAEGVGEVWHGVDFYWDEMRLDLAVDSYRMTPDGYLYFLKDNTMLRTILAVEVPRAPIDSFDR